MKFRFQNKKELFLTHEDNEEEGLYAEPGWEDWEIHEPPKKPAWDDWEIHNLMPEDPSPAPPTTPKKTKKVWHKKTSSCTATSPGMDDSTST